MPLAFEWLLAIRFLKEGRMQSWLILAGVVGGVAIIIFLTQLINQLQRTIIDRVLSSQAHIVMRPSEEIVLRSSNLEEMTSAIIQQRGQRLRSIDQWESFAQLARTTPGIKSVSPLATGPVFARNNMVSQSVVLMGILPDDYLKIVNMQRYLIAGKFDTSSEQTVIGVELAKELGVGLGDRIQVINESGTSQNLTIVGLFDINNKELNKRWVFTQLRLAQSLLNIPGGVSSIELTVNELFNAKLLAKRLSQQSGLLVESWMETNSGLLNALSNQSVTNNLIRVFIVIIVSLGIASVLVVSVVQKQKEIGILRAMGATQQQILRIFLLQGAIFGSLGSLMGVSLAFALLTLFASLYKSPDGSIMFTAQIDPNLMVMATLVALLVGVLAALLPARRAARMNPVQAIRS
jgi:lipoprotein-releasing system permease protein